MCRKFDQNLSIIFSARLLAEGLHHTGPFETSDDIETLAGINGALVTLVSDTGSQGELEVPFYQFNYCYCMCTI